MSAPVSSSKKSSSEVQVIRVRSQKKSSTGSVVSPAKLRITLNKIGKIMGAYTSSRSGNMGADDFSHMSSDITAQLGLRTYGWLNKHVCSIDYELPGLSRDLFENNTKFDSAGLVKKYRVFNTKSYDYSKEEAGEGVAVLGDLQAKLPWALVFRAYISPYSDEDYDIHGTLTLIFGQPELVKQHVAKQVADLSADNLKFFLENSAELVTHAEEFAPQASQEIYQRLVKELYQSDFGKRLFASLQHEDMQINLPLASTSSSSSPQPKL